MQVFWQKSARKSDLSRYFYDFEVAEVAIVYVEANEGSNLMPSLQSCCSWIDVKQPKAIVILHFQDMAVS